MEHIGTSLLSLGIIIYFIKDQFSFSAVTKVRFLFLPLFCLYQFVSKIDTMDLNGFIYFVALFIISALIGVYQGKDFMTKSYLRKGSFTIDDDGKRHHLYRERLFSKGGNSYLIGWIIMFVITLLVETNFHIHFNLLLLLKELLLEIMKDLTIWLRVTDKTSNWQIWEILGVSNIVYLIRIRMKSPKLNNYFKNDLEEID
ncbi:hypothetical protein GSH19_04115 [Lactobacillus sp. S2-2]|uniref:hypothetical protein n=1 Tax=Lactobacillus sp. S2-2 TaxID=2692917 RepID=UPI001F3EB7D2|nr:hypothetical protein [Lactobacillus sp. S2-2]MCF6515340.1 hypothetical protein [Lactobacillus sp. S2-2]